MDKSKTAQDSAEASNEKMLKPKSKSASERKSVLDFRKYTKQIWLAGLGAFSRAEEEGNKLFDSLVKVGEELESKTADIADFLLSRASLAIVPFAAFGADQESDWFRLSVGTCDLNELPSMFEQLENALLELSH